MPQGEVVQEIRDQEVLHLAGQRHRLVSQSERVGHARHILIEILLHRTHREDVAERLFRMFGEPIRPMLQILHVMRQEAEHQLFDLPFVFLVVGLQCHLHIGESERLAPSGLTHRTDISVKHGQELQRIQLLVLEAYPDMQFVTAQSHRLPGLEPLPEVGEDIRQVSVCYLVPVIADRLADTEHRVVTHARHDTAGDGPQRIAPHVEVDAVMKEFFARHRVRLLTVAERQLHFFTLRLLERHTVTALGVQDHFLCIFHSIIY